MLLGVPVGPEDKVLPPLFFFFSFFITLGLELSDTKVYEPEIRALLGTAFQYCEAVVLAPSLRPVTLR